MTDPFSILVGAVSIAGIGGKAVEAAHKFQGDYRRASKQIDHTLAQLEVLQSYLEKADSSQSHLELHETVLSSLHAIANSFPQGLNFESKRGKLKWAVRQKSQAIEVLAHLRDTELSAILSMQFQSLYEIVKVRAAIERIVPEETSSKIKKKTERPFLAMVPVEQCDRTLVATELQINSTISKHTGIGGGIMMFKSGANNVYSIRLRLRKFGCTIVRARIMLSWPSWCNLTIQPSVKIQKVIWDDAPILQACREQNTQVMRDLFHSRRAHPNDTTADNLTLLCTTESVLTEEVAISEGKTEAARLLLDYHADADLTYGIYETSPLCTAFLYGQLEIARLPIQAGGSLEYVTRRKWSCPRYLFEPRSSNPCTVELLNLCHKEDFADWNTPDVHGWTIMHRAAAFGQASDIRKLLNLKAKWNLATFKLHWLPIFCAVKYGNESTFGVLARLLQPADLACLRDVRGWTLLHLATECGSHIMIAELLQCGCDPIQVSDKSDMSVPAGLEMIELTPADIAKACGHQDIYKELLEASR